jgi:hypothetical protein
MKNRETHPLDPVYQMPGRNETPLDILKDPFGEKGCSMSKTNYKSTKELMTAAKADKPPLSMAASAKSSAPRPQTASQ